MNLIEQLGLEKCKQILGGAPEGGQGDQYIGVKFEWYYKRSGLNVFFWHMDEWCQLSDNFQAEMISIADLRTAIACHATLTNKDSTYKAQTIDTIYLCKIADELILNDSCVITVTFTGSTSVVLIGSSKQMVINRVGDVINLLFNNESYSLKKDQIEAALRPYLGSRTLIQAFG